MEGKEVRVRSYQGATGISCVSLSRILESLPSGLTGGVVTVVPEV